MRIAVAMMVLLVVAFVAIGFLPLVVLRKDAEHVLGHFPLFIVWYPSHPRDWSGMGRHLLLSADLTAIILLAWGLYTNRWPRSRNNLLAIAVLVAMMIGIAATFT